MKKNYKDLGLIIVFVFILGLSINVHAASYECDGIFSPQLLNDLNNYVYKPIKWLTPIALLLLTSIDFAGVVFAGKKESMDKAKNNFLKRSVAAIIIFFVPDLIILIAELASGVDIKACMPYFN